MITQIQVTWNNEFQNDGLLYFFQRIVEMLDFRTVDIFRSPLLNTPCLIIEYLSISHGSAKEYNLGEVYQEFLVSLKHDVIIKYNWGHDRINQLEKKLKNESSNRQTIMEYLCHTIGSSYLEWTKKYITFIVPQTQEKRKIECAVRCLIPELIRYGYSRDEIYHGAKQVLCNNILSEQALQNFLNRYDCSKHKYIVYMSVSNNLLVFKETLETRLEVSFEDDGNFNKLETWERYCKVRTKYIEALDASSAANQAYKSIELFTSFYQFFGNYSERLIRNRVLVVSESSEEQKITIERSKYFSIEETSPPQIGKMSEYIITNLLQSARCSIPQLEKIVKLHNRAIANNGLENGFLNLWAILEVICINNPEISHIQQVLDIVVPILKYDYLPVLFRDIAENLKRIIEPAEYEQFLADIDSVENDNERIAALMLLPEHSSKLDLLIDYLTSYPVLRSRILNLHDNCHTRKDIKAILDQYAQRTSWHIYRIYRVRNSIVHTGKRPPYLKDIGEHLHSYVDSVANEVILKLSFGTLCHTSNVLVDSELQHKKWDDYFSESESIDTATVDLIFSSQKSSWDE